MHLLAFGARFLSNLYEMLITDHGLITGRGRHLMLIEKKPKVL